MKKFKNFLFIGILLFAISCQKEKAEPVATDEMSFQSLTEAFESGLDLETLKDYSNASSNVSHSVQSIPSGNSASTRSEILTFYSDPAAFEAACPDLPTEDFEEGNIPDGAIANFPHPLNENTDNFRFSSGEILPGVTINTGQDFGGGEIALLGAGWLGLPTTSKTIFSNFATGFIIDFTAGDVQGVSMTVFSVFGESDIEIEIFGVSGSLGTTTVFGTNAGTFWGVQATEAITQITLISLTQFEGIDDLAFGTCDSDGDGCPDSVDPHPNSNVDPTVVIDGCDSGVENAFPVDCSNMSDLIADCAAAATNHGEFVSCVAALTNAWKDAGKITGTQKGAIQSCAGQANIP